LIIVPIVCHQCRLHRMQIPAAVIDKGVTGAVNTGGICAADVVDIGGKFATGVVDTGGAP
jgi:hypothetical protein